LPRPKGLTAVVVKNNTKLIFNEWKVLNAPISNMRGQADASFQRINKKMKETKRVMEISILSWPSRKKRTKANKNKLQNHPFEVARESSHSE
jgi:hypothetical protein